MAGSHQVKRNTSQSVPGIDQTKPRSKAARGMSQVSRTIRSTRRKSKINQESVKALLDNSAIPFSFKGTQEKRKGCVSKSNNNPETPFQGECQRLNVNMPNDPLV